MRKSQQLPDPFSHQEFAVQLCLSEHTVKGYVREVLAKLGVRSRGEVVLLANGRELTA